MTTDIPVKAPLYALSYVTEKIIQKEINNILKLNVLESLHDLIKKNVPNHVAWIEHFELAFKTLKHV